MLFIGHLFSRYHTGSLAFGSLILAIVQVIRVILEYMDQKLKGLVASKFSMFSIFCFRMCLQKLFRFLHFTMFALGAIPRQSI